MVEQAGSGVQVESIGAQRRRAAKVKSARPATTLLDRQFDCAGPVALRRSYIIASTPMCGSTFLCARLWQTGALGAPAEYFRKAVHGSAGMMERLEASAPPDFLTKLLACRTSPNGIFGMNVNFRDFEETLRNIPGLLGVLSPVTFIHLDRADTMVQAAYSAKLTQRDAPRQGRKLSQPTFRYDRNLISKWLGRIERQRLGWTRWFLANKIEPFVVTYDRLTADPAAAVKSIVELLGVQNDAAQRISLPLANEPSDEISKAWAARFWREIEMGVKQHDDVVKSRPLPAVSADKTGRGVEAHKVGIKTSAKHVFDRYDQFRDVAVRPITAMRLRHRHNGIVWNNRELFRKTRVLDIRSGDGRWSLAALDAGAAHVVGLESRREPVEVARSVFTKMGVDPASYEFVHARILATLRVFDPGSFDLILCKEFSPEPFFFLSSLRRLRPRHIILDTAMARGTTPFAEFKTKPQNKAPLNAGRAAIGAVPTHEMVMMFAEFFGFRSRTVDWHTLGIRDWTGIRDYDRGRRRTYVLDRIEALQGNHAP
jgi:LPS sulfotransferase NodH